MLKRRAVEHSTGGGQESTHLVQAGLDALARVEEEERGGSVGRLTGSSPRILCCQEKGDGKFHKHK